MAQVCYVPEAFLPFTPAYLLQLSAEERRAVVSDLRQAWELYRAANDAFASEYALSAGELHERFLSSVVQSYEEKARNGSSRVRRRSEEMGDLPAAKRARSYNKLADAEASDLELHDHDSDNDNDDSDPDSAHGAEGYDHSSETPTVSSDSGEAAASYSARPESGASAVPSSSAIVRRRYAEPCGCPSNPLLTLLSKWPCTCSHKSGDSIDAREPMAAGTKSGGCRHHGRDRRSSRYRCSPSKAFLSRVRRTLGTRFYLLQLDVEERTSDTADWRFEVLDRSQDDQTLCYHTVTIGLVPSCNCPNSAKGVNCEHILFVLLRVLMVPLSDPVIFQRALVASELHSIFTARLNRSSRRVCWLCFEAAWVGDGLDEEDEIGDSLVGQPAGSLCSACPRILHPDCAALWHSLPLAHRLGE